MIESKRTLFRRALVALVLAGVALSPALAREKVGDVFPMALNTARDYAGSPDGQLALAWQHEIYQPGATYLALHFRDFQLAAGDFLVVSDAAGGQQYRLDGRGKMDAGTFWARHVKGDTVRLQLFSTGTTGGQGFSIDEIAVGNQPIGGYEPEATCGADDLDNAVCYQASHPTEYDRSRAVARLLISGAWLCTGSLISPSNHFLTNEHCITSASEALNTDYEFMAEAPNCGSSNCQLCYPGTVFSGATFLQDNASLDYSLVQITGGNPAGTYGWLEIDNRDAVVGESIYIPQHPGGRAKELGIFSTVAQDASDGLCHVNTVSAAPCSGSGYNDVGYYCDTEGGSSGSPVLARSSHKIIALHHCANCPNRGVPIDLVYAEIAGFLGPQCAVDADCDNGTFCDGAETCSNGACLSGTDPCPGQNCNETGQTCEPIVCDDNGICDGAQEDCVTCPGDCISGSAGAVCGNSICETGAGEDCLGCPQDCAGVTSGNPRNRYCCGSDVGCGDARCNVGGLTCTLTGGTTSYCCGDGTCEGDENAFNCDKDCGSATTCPNGTCETGLGEDVCSCSADCGSPAISEIGQCTDGIDNDCDGPVDCDDTNCDTDPACGTGGTCGGSGDACSVDGDCCSSNCKRGTCKGN